MNICLLILEPFHKNTYEDLVKRPPYIDLPIIINDTYRLLTTAILCKITNRIRILKDQMRPLELWKNELLLMLKKWTPINV